MWLYCLIPILVGPIITMPIGYCLLTPFGYPWVKGEYTVGGIYYSGIGAWVPTSIMLTIVIISCGIPYSMTCGQLRAADDYLLPSQSKNIHCWRNPDDKFQAQDVSYLTLEESAWVVDYKKTWKQKVFTLVDEEDGNIRYNFCAAPIVYNGQVKLCTYNLWAVCYRRTTRVALTACNEADAVGCGWNFPANTVTTRVINGNEEFFEAAPEEERVQINKIRTLTLPAPAGKQNPVMVYYADDGPDAMKDQRSATKKSLDIQYTCYMVIWGVLTALLAIYLVLN